MHLASIKPDDLAVVRNDSYVLVKDLLAHKGLLPGEASMIDLITRYDSLKDSLAKAVERAPQIKLDPKRLGPPAQRPSKIWAAASNYKRGSLLFKLP